MKDVLNGREIELSYAHDFYELTELSEMLLPFFSPLNVMSHWWKRAIRIRTGTVISLADDTFCAALSFTVFSHLPTHNSAHMKQPSTNPATLRFQGGLWFVCLHPNT